MLNRLIPVWSLVGTLLVLPLRAVAAQTDPAGATGGSTLPAHGTHAPYVAQSAFTTDVVRREPVDNITTLAASANRVYYFTDLRNMEGQTVIHRWEYKGRVVGQIPFKVGGPRWRVYSMKTLKPSMSGEWKASVVNSAGVTLAVNTFDYGAPPASGTAPEVHQQH